MTQIGSRTTGGVMRIGLATGGSGYAGRPTVSLSGGGGTGATAYAVMAGTMVDNVIVFAGGSGYTSAPTVAFSGGTPASAASATATVHSGDMRYMTFFKGRYNDMYGVDGMGRGIRWDGDSASVEPIGLNKPLVGPGVTASATGSSSVVAVQIVNGGAGYNNAPTVSFATGALSTSGTTRPASARAYIANGRVSRIAVLDGGVGYSSAPLVTLSGGIGTGATFGVVLTGGIADIRITSGGSGYTANATTSPSITLHNTKGLTGAHAEVVSVGLGKIQEVAVRSPGAGNTTTGITASVTGGGGTNAALSVTQFFSVDSLTIGNSGSGYMTPPVITFLPASGDPTGGGAAATCSVNDSGNISSVTVFQGGTYSKPPTAVILDTAARAMATLEKPLNGVYQCCFRYLDDTAESQGGPIPSSISDLVEVDCVSGASVLNWNLATTGLDDRVSAAELWRTTADQSVMLFRVATIQRANFGNVYQDTLTDADLSDSARDGYGLMPITLPSGQVNARRFEVPPPEFAVACMFQDRAWYGVDTTGERPNSLMYSEIDEPESVPEVNELVIQENTSDPDKLVAMIPLGSMLLLVQTAHLYRLTYVAQPVIDAAIVLVGYRGALNSRCWDVLGGAAFIVDSDGMYAFDGQNEEAVSVPIDNFWRDKLIDFSKAGSFHVRADAGTRTVRFYYCKVGDAGTYPTRALCYCAATKAWWEETYPSAVPATVRLPLAGKLAQVSANATGGFTKESGTSDSGSAISYQLRTGAMPLVNESGRRTITFLYRPTAGDSTLNVQLAYNNSDTPRTNAIASDRGTGFVTTTGSTNTSLNMKKTRSPLGDSSGVARAYFSGRNDPDSSGGDRHVAVIVAGTASETVTVHSIAVEGCS